MISGCFQLGRAKYVRVRDNVSGNEAAMQNLYYYLGLDTAKPHEVMTLN